MADLRKPPSLSDALKLPPSEPNPRIAKANEKDAMQSGWQPGQWMQNLKAGLTLSEPKGNK